MSRPAAVLALGSLVVLSACGQRGDAGAVPTDTAVPGVVLPADPDALVLQVAYTGGFTTPEMLAGRLPPVSVYADGRVVSEGPGDAAHPGAAWPDLRLQRLEPAQLHALVDEALAAGVADATDLGSPPIADAPSTRFTVVTAEQTSVREVYALSEASGSPGLTAEQEAARGALLDLRDELTGLADALQPPAPAAYQPTGVAVLAREWSPVPDTPAEVPWPGPPLPGEPAGPGVTCVVVAGDQVQQVADAARDAGRLTPWVTGDGRRWSLTFRPLLPHETGCADLT